MRKADYQSLALIIGRHAVEARRAAQQTNDNSAVAIAHARLSALRDIAHDFARVASIDKAAFLRVCAVD